MFYYFMCHFFVQILSNKTRNNIITLTKNYRRESSRNKTPIVFRSLIYTIRLRTACYLSVVKYQSVTVNGLLWFRSWLSERFKRLYALWCNYHLLDGSHNARVVNSDIVSPRSPYTQLKPALKHSTKWSTNLEVSIYVWIGRFIYNEIRDFGVKKMF